MTVTGVRRIAGILELHLGWDAGFRGPELARLRDADHSSTAEAVSRLLAARGWHVVPEASFNRYGDRGRIDLLAFHPATCIVLVIEIKTVIVDVQDLLGSLDVKVRVGAGVARTHGWEPADVAPALIVADSRTNRRRVAAHERLFARLDLRGAAALRWLRGPTPSAGGLLLFRTLPNRNTSDRRQAGRQRVRHRAPRGSVDGSRGGGIPTPSRG